MALEKNMSNDYKVEPPNQLEETADDTYQLGEKKPSKIAKYTAIQPTKENRYFAGKVNKKIKELIKELQKEEEIIKKDYNDLYEAVKECEFSKKEAKEIACCLFYLGCSFDFDEILDNRADKPLITPDTLLYKISFEEDTMIVDNRKALLKAVKREHSKQIRIKISMKSTSEN